MKLSSSFLLLTQSLAKDSKFLNDVVYPEALRDEFAARGYDTSRLIRYRIFRIYHKQF